MNRLLRFITAVALPMALCSTATPRPAAAWGDDGHVIIALMAYKLLDPAVRGKVDTMLAADNDPLTAGDFPSRATWADKAREALRDGGGYSPSRTWHFTNIELANGDADAACQNHPLLPVGTPASAGPAACSIDKVEQFTAELSGSATAPSEKLLALKFLIHIVGDLHQPLHAADDRDGGGNGVYVVPDGRFYPISLHAYWDTEVIKAMSPVQRAGFTRRFPLLDRALLATIADGISDEYSARRDEWLTGRPREWALDAFAKARDVAYHLGPQMGSSRDGKPVHRIDASYERAAIAVAREQLAKAGLRLAALLNGALRRWAPS